MARARAGRRSREVHGWASYRLSPGGFGSSALGDRAPMVVLADEAPTAAEPQLLSAVEALLTA
jgi:hypothetical protein